MEVVGMNFRVPGIQNYNWYLLTLFSEESGELWHTHSFTETQVGKATPFPTTPFLDLERNISDAF